MTFFIFLSRSSQQSIATELFETTSFRTLRFRTFWMSLLSWFYTSSDSDCISKSVEFNDSDIVVVGVPSAKFRKLPFKSLTPPPSPTSPALPSIKSLPLVLTHELGKRSRSASLPSQSPLAFSPPLRSQSCSDKPHFVANPLPRSPPSFDLQADRIHPNVSQTIAPKYPRIVTEIIGGGYECQFVQHEPSQSKDLEIMQPPPGPSPQKMTVPAQATVISLSKTDRFINSFAKMRRCCCC